MNRKLCSFIKFPLFIKNDYRSFSSNVEQLANEVLRGSRGALAKAITLVESTKSDHQQLSHLLMESIVKQNINRKRKTFRVGISGPPGVGKSTFIEALGTYLVKEAKQTYKVAVLAVDPSSQITGGSILGDKTRMEELSRNPNAYVRPSPTRGTLGGVTRSTYDAIQLCEAAGYNITLVETVGVGQSETAVEQLTDMFVLLLPPAGGDELQGIKKGIMELVDMVIINKADGDLLASAKKAQSDYSTALHFLQPKSSFWIPSVSLCSAASKFNISEVWSSMDSYWKKMEESNLLERKRGQQRTSWMWKMIQDELMNRFQGNLRVQEKLLQTEKLVQEGKITPGFASDSLLHEFLHSQH